MHSGDALKGCEQARGQGETHECLIKLGHSFGLLKFDTFTAGENSVSSSVVDPNTLNLDPDPEFWPNLDPDPGLCYQF